MHMSRKIFIHSCLFALVGGALFLSCGEEEKKELRQTAVVSYIVGTLDFKGAHGTDWHQARVGFKIVSGDMVRAGPDSRAEVQLRGPKSIIRVGENTTLTLQYSEAADRKNVNTHLKDGNLWARVKRLKESEMFAFESSMAKAIARGTTMRMRAEGDTLVTVFAYEGIVEVKTETEYRGRKRVSVFNVGQGQFITLQKGKLPINGFISEDDPWRNGWQPKKMQELEEEALKLPVSMRIEEKPRKRRVSSPALTKMRMLRKEILGIDPKTFSKVRLKLDGKRYLEDSDLLRMTKKVELSEIEIGVISKAWDAHAPDRKEELLILTFRILKNNYPDVTEFVTLKFDDNRQDLKLEYARYAQMADEKGS